MKFTLRDIFWLTLVVAIALSWWITSPPTGGYSEGFVSINGQPLRTGRILFHSEDERIYAAWIRNGEYKISLGTIGKFKVTVEGDGVPDDQASLANASEFEIFPRARNTITMDFDQQR